MAQDSPEPEYICPGQDHAISRAVHLGRLAHFFPACRECPHREDTGTLSSQKVKHLEETRLRGNSRSIFGEEGVCGEYLNEIQPADIGRLATAFGVFLKRQRPERSDSPTVAIAGDGRSTTSEPLAAAAEGVRFAGCNLVNVGTATSPCLADAIDLLDADGGLLIGNADERPGHLEIKFWTPGAAPLSAGPGMGELERLYSENADRPSRSYGSLRRFNAVDPYLDRLVDHYHALRPLRFLLDTRWLPLPGYLQRLTEPVACRAIPMQFSGDALPGLIAGEQAHFAVRVGDAGETCHIFDERGRAVDGESLLLLIARHLLKKNPGGTVAIPKETSPAIGEAISAMGGRTVVADRSRRATHAEMRRQRALCGGTDGRIWYATAGNHCSADALRTITLLLELLSQSDSPLSEVVEHVR